MALAPWIILAFLASLALIAFRHAREVRTGQDFALAGRRLGPAVVIGTLVATWIGTGSLFGNAEFTYEHGLAGFFLPLAGGAGILVLVLLAPRARKLEAESVPEILALRFGRSAQLLGAIALIAAYLVIVSYQYRAGAAVAARLFPGAHEGVLLIGFAAFIVLYTAIAGMISVAWTDLLNGILMAVGLLIALAWAWRQWDPELTPLPAELKQASGGEPPLAWVGFLLPAFLLVLGDANLYQRFMSARSAGTARRAAVGMLIGVIVMECVVIALALLARLLLAEPPANPAHAIIDLAYTTLPPAIGILILATATAVIVTTADSYLLGASTSVAVDLTAGLRSPARQRVIVIGLGLVALGLAYTSDRFFRVALYAYTLYGASLTPAVLCALLRPATPGRAIVAGMGAGLGTALAWKLLATQEMLPPALAGIDPVLPALLANLVALVGVAVVVRVPAGE
ncbi:MAG: sodium:solute symporter family protein [Phycisphaerales bacterium]|nr:sodium:solute symporter family protein [Phycisphaerales bacterium]NNM27281.1 sodium:solute symporter family protein [Phycisphaerales bacterium]